MPVLSNLIVRIGASTDDFDKQVDRSLNKMKRFAADASAAGQALSIGFSAPIIAAGAAAIKAGSDMESLTMGLKAVMKSSEATSTEMAKLREVAKLPGLGLEEAVKGSIRLQILGNSADQSRRIMGELGNALAVVGGGREDFNEVIRQLSQLGAVGKVTKENLDPIIERIPQLAAIIKEKFGPEALGDPAKTFEKLGISSQQFIQIITDELAKGERAGNTYKNSWDNIQMAAKDAAAEFGKTLLPIAQRVLDDFMTPAIQKAKDLAIAFQQLSPATQDWALAIGAVVVATPIVVTGIAMMIEKAALITASFLKLASVFTTVTTAIGAWGLAAGNYIAGMAGVQAGTAAATAALGLFYAAAVVASGSVVYLLGTLNQLYDAEKKVSESSSAMTFAGARLAESIQKHGGAAAAQLKVYDGLLAIGTLTQEQYNVKLRDLAGGLQTLAPLARDAGEAHKKTAEAASNLIKVNTVMLDQNGQLSKNSLVYVESLERVKAAVGKIKDVMYEWSIQGTSLGKMLEYHRAPLDNLAIAADDYRLALSKARFELEALGKMPAIQMATPTQPERRGTILEAGDILRDIGGSDPVELRRKADQAAAGYERLIELQKQGKATTSQVKAAYEAWGKAEQAASGRASASAKAQAAALRQVSTVITDLSRGITDVIFKGGNLAKMFQDVAMQAAQSITRLLIEGALKKLSDKLFEVGGVAGKVFGGGTGTIMSAAPGAAKPAISGGGGMGGAVGAASGGVMGAVTMVSGIVSAVSGVIGNFQMAGMNKTLDLIEKEVRYSQIHLLNLLEKNNEFLPNLKNIWESLIRMEQRQMTVAGAGNVNITINSSGGDPRAMLDALTRELKQLGVIPR